MVLFASAKSVGGALMTNRNLYLVSILLFRGAFPYPVVIKILTFLQNTEGVSRLAIW